VDNPAFVARPEARRRLEQQRAYDDIALLHVSANDWDKLVARAAVLRQRNARKESNTWTSSRSGCRFATQTS
jgi:hypothetical protein